MESSMHSLRNRFLILLASVVLSISCGGHGIESPANFIEQGRVGEFLALFGTVNADEGYNIMQTRDDGLLIAGNGNGTIAPADGTISNLMMTKLDESGEVDWSKLLPPRGFLRINGVIETSLFEYVVMFNDHPNLTLLKIDGSAQTQSQLYARLGHAYGDHLLQKTHDGAYILTGEYSKGEFSQGTFLVKISSNGSVIWNKEFERSYGFARSVLATKDNGAIVSGEKFYEDQRTDTDLIVFKADQTGGLLWSKIYGNSDEDERGRSIAQADDGGFIIAGQTSNRKLSDYDAFFVKLDANGNLQWRFNFSTDRYATANSVVSSGDGFIFTGSAGRDILVGKINLQSEVAWTRRINPQTKYGWGNSIIRLRNGKFAITGSYGEGGGFGGGEYDAFLLVVDNNGNFVDQ